MSIEKENFLRSRLIPLLQKLDPATPPVWGKMNLHQMIEHFTDVTTLANGTKKLEVVTPAGRLPVLREFMMSDKPFRENTKNPLLPEDPPPTHTRTLQAAIGELQQELIRFFEVFEKDPALKTVHPIFGELDFNENIQLLHKHALHHLKQFGAEPLQS
ncbi:MAG: hypothetical protein U0U70_00975 [Chitinophagaceae bacterium]